MRAPADAREWVSFADPDEDRTWLVDVTFLLSSWSCLYGRGCEGVLTVPAAGAAEGCCSYGAHFADDDDVARVERAAASLGAHEWQWRAIGARRGVVARRGGVATTRLVKDACIFLNRPGFAGGPGCALHRAALERGEPPIELKPDVCWQLPLRRDDVTASDGHVTSTLTQWERRHWGPAGEEFHWWCSEEPAAYRPGAPVYKTLAGEIAAIVGEPVYARIADYLDSRRAPGVPLAHPTVRGRPAR